MTSPAASPEVEQADRALRDLRATTARVAAMARELLDQIEPADPPRSAPDVHR